MVEVHPEGDIRGTRNNECRPSNTRRTRPHGRPVLGGHPKILENMDVRLVILGVLEVVDVRVHFREHRRCTRSLIRGCRKVKVEGRR